MAVISPLWPYSAASMPWTDRNGLLTDQSRLWIEKLFKTVTTHGSGPVQLGGDIGGTSTVPLVIGLQGRPIGAITPTNGQVLTWSSTNSDWEPKTVTVPVPAVVSETPGGTMNGSNKAFTLSFVPNPGASLTLWLNGVEQVPATDYTISAATVTYVVAPKSTDLMIAQYTH